MHTLFPAESVFHTISITQPGSSDSDTGDQNTTEHPSTSLTYFLSDADQEEVLPVEQSFGLDVPVMPHKHRGYFREMSPSGFSPEQIPPPPKA